MILNDCPYYVPEEKMETNKDHQIIDITDDFTGSPHQVAKDSIFMYINEAGRSKEFVQNVEAREKDKQAIYYDFVPQNIMKRGDRVELLVDYFGTCYFNILLSDTFVCVCEFVPCP
jgi:hypothetical protein